MRRHDLTWGFALFVIGACVACGTPPKPAELVAFEQMRSEGEAETVKERHPDLYEEAEKYYKRALEAHEDDEPETALHNTRLASITWRTALARSQEKDAQDSLRAAIECRPSTTESITRESEVVTSIAG